MDRWQAAQGIQTGYTITIRDGSGNPITTYLGNEAMTAVFWPGGNYPTTFTVTPTWNTPSAGTVDVIIPAASTASVTPGLYEVRVFFTDNSAEIYRAILELEPSPAAATTTLPDLITIPYFQLAVGEIVLDSIQQDYLPYAIAAASKAVRRFCGDRDFTQWTYTKEFVPGQNGVVRLDQFPVNQVTRIQGNRTSALSITQTSTSVTAARVYFSYTGDQETGITYTGLSLVSTSSGVATTQNILWSSLSPATVGSLATAINALGGGWSATVASGGSTPNTSFSTWPVTELLGGDVAQGCAGSDSASLDVYADDIDNCSLDWEHGFLYVGYQTQTTALGPTWGPDWAAFDLPAIRPTQNKVKVTYNAGFASIPALVQEATAEVAKAILERLKTDSTLRTESAGAYSYALRDVIPSLPDPVKQGLSLYRNTTA